MIYKQGPSIIDTLPINHAKGISLDTDIVIKFNIDIAKSSISSNVNMYDSRGVSVPITIAYGNKELTIRPKQPLQGDHTYRVVVNGDNDPENPKSHKGITSALNYPMLGDYNFSFTTFSNKMAVESIISGSPHNIVITTQPIIKVDTSDKTLNSVENVLIEISDTNTFESILWSGNTGQLDMLATQGLQPDIELADGSYYWRAKVIGTNGDGDWSEPFAFSISTNNDSSVVEDDSIKFDPAFPADWEMLGASIVETYPQEGHSNTSVNLKTITIVVDQILPKEDISKDMFKIVGIPVDGDDASEHEIDGTLDVLFDESKNTTTLIYTLPVIGGES